MLPHAGHAGEWSDFSDTTCNGSFIHGVAIETFPEESGSGRSKFFPDNRGATNLKMACSDGLEFEGTSNDKRYLCIALEIKWKIIVSRKHRVTKNMNKT